jgi:hypothetical protein
MAGHDAAGDLQPEAVLGGRAATGSATRQAANGKCRATTARGYFPALGELFSLLGDE